MRVAGLLPEPVAQGVVRHGQIAGRKELVQMRIHKYGSAVIVRSVGLHAAVREFRLAGCQKAHDAAEIVVGAHQDERADVRGVARIARGEKGKSARETHADDGHWAGAEPLLQPAGGFADRADRRAIDVIIGESRDLRRQHREAVAGRRARKIHEPRLVDPQMMNPVHENHARRMGNSARHVHPALAQGLASWKA